MLPVQFAVSPAPLSFPPRSVPILVPAAPRRRRQPGDDVRQRHVVGVDQLEHGAAAEGHRDDGRPQQAAVAPGQDAAGDLRPGEAHRRAPEGNQGQGGTAQGIAMLCYLDNSVSTGNVLRVARANHATFTRQFTIKITSEILGQTFCVSVS